VPKGKQFELTCPRVAIDPALTAVRSRRTILRLWANDRRASSFVQLPAKLPTFQVLYSTNIVLGMELTDEELQEFRAIWNRAFKEEIPPGDARLRALQLIELYAQLARPLPSERESSMSPDPCAISSIAENRPSPRTAKSYPSNPSGTK
jgi:hypothetical protein